MGAVVALLRLPLGGALKIGSLHGSSSSLELLVSSTTLLGLFEPAAAAAAASAATACPFVSCAVPPVVVARTSLNCLSMSLRRI
jgi:hypothetical protein